MSDNWHDAVASTEVTTDSPFVKIIEDKAIAIFNVEGEYVAIEDSCTHQALPLSEGPVENGEIECPFHGARFCLKTGEAKAAPACYPLKTFETRLIDERIQVKVGS